MSGDSIEAALTADHERLDALPIERLRAEMVRHIRWEEEHPFPAVERAGGNAAARHFESLRADHEVIREAMAAGNAERQPGETRETQKLPQRASICHTDFRRPYPASAAAEAAPSGPVC